MRRRRAPVAVPLAGLDHAAHRVRTHTPCLQHIVNTLLTVVAETFVR